jgi:ApbE superfamily uncharacterized protein (UPF0280 family)
VELQVGAMTFPAGQLWVGEYWRHWPEAAGVFDVEPVAPLSVQSGGFAHRDVMVTNRTTQPEVLVSGRDLMSAVTDGSGRVVGLYVGPRNAMRVGFPIEPQQSTRVPVLIGTASVVPELGYAVPPGKWGLVVLLQTESGRWLQASLDVTITP